MTYTTVDPTSCEARVRLKDSLERLHVLAAVEEGIGGIAEGCPALAEPVVKVALEALRVVLERVRRGERPHVDGKITEGPGLADAAAPRAGWHPGEG